MAQHKIYLKGKRNLATLVAADEAASLDFDVAPVELFLPADLREKLIEGDYLVIDTPEGTWLGEVEENDGFRAGMIVKLT